MFNICYENHQNILRDLTIIPSQSKIKVRL